MRTIVCVHTISDSAVRFDQWLSLGLFSIVLLLHGSVRPVPQEFLHLRVVPQIQMAEMPVAEQQHATALLPEVTAQAYTVVDIASSTVLVSKQADEALYPASTTKLLTALVAAEQFQQDEVWQLQQVEMTEYSTVGLRAGDRITVRALMMALLIESDNAAAEIFASRYPGGREAFITAMREYAQSKHLSRTEFVSPAGFDDPLQQITAMDLVILAREVMKKPWLLELTSMARAQIELNRAGQHIQLLAINTNKLLTSPLGVVGIKTGTTPAAGEVLVSLVKNQGHPLLVVVMGSHARFSDTQQLILWTQKTYSWQSI